MAIFHTWITFVVREPIEFAAMPLATDFESGENATAVMPGSALGVDKVLIGDPEEASHSSTIPIWVDAWTLVKTAPSPINELSDENARELIWVAWVGRFAIRAWLGIFHNSIAGVCPPVATANLSALLEKANALARFVAALVVIRAVSCAEERFQSSTMTCVAEGDVPPMRRVLPSGENSMARGSVMVVGTELVCPRNSLLITWMPDFPATATRVASGEKTTELLCVIGL